MSFVLSCALAVLTPDVVELSDGSKLVGRVLDGRDPSVAVLSAAGRVEVPRERVRDIVTASDLKARHRELEAAGDALHCVLGRGLWCLDHGLWEEALDELDTALRLDASHAGTQSLLEKAGRRVSLGSLWPARLDDRAAVLDLVQLAGGRRPGRAAVAARWLRESELPETVQHLQSLADSARIELRRAVLDVLVARADGEALPALILRSLEEKDEALRERARAAVLAQDHPDLVVPYVHALRSSKDSMRDNALPVLESLQDPRAIAPLISMLAPRQSGSSSVPRNHIFVGNQISVVQDFEVEIAQGAVIANPVIGVLTEGSLLDVRVTSAGFGGYAGRNRVIGALERLSGRRFGDDFPAWRAWWEKEGKQVLAAFRKAREEEQQEPATPAAAQAKQMQ